MKILIIEDSDAIFKSLEKYISDNTLLSEIARVKPNNSGSSIYINNSPDLIIADESFSQSDTIEMLRNLVSNNPGATIILLTHSLYDYRRKMYDELGVNRCYGKLFDLDLFILELESLLIENTIVSKNQDYSEI